MCVYIYIYYLYTLNIYIIMYTHKHIIAYIHTLYHVGWLTCNQWSSQHIMQPHQRTICSHHFVCQHQPGTS